MAPEEERERGRGGGGFDQFSLSANIVYSSRACATTRARSRASANANLMQLRCGINSQITIRGRGHPPDRVLAGFSPRGNPFQLDASKDTRSKGVEGGRVQLSLAFLFQFFSKSRSGFEKEKNLKG